LLASLVCAAPAGAFTPPEVYVRLAFANSIDHTPQSDWMPLAAAPTLNWLGGYEIGYVAQDAPGSGDSQRAALQIIQVPDGQPTQPGNEPFCTGGPRTVGEIVPVGSKIQFEGSGTYGVRVSIGPPSGGPNDCMSGSGTASTNASFNVDAPVAATLVGNPLVFRSAPLAGNPFVGPAATDPPGGSADTRCARDATVQPDGSVTGPLAIPSDPERSVARILEVDLRPGDWTCVARGTVEGVDDNNDAKIFATPWSAPLRFDVRSDFRRSRSVISKPGATRPSIRFTAEFPEAAGGGKGKLALRRYVRCKSKKPVLKSAGTYTAKFDSKGRATMKVRRPGSGYYAGTLSFAGTRFYTKSTDPNPLLFEVGSNRRLEFVSRQGFPSCGKFP
jgi:hypothetical protein